MNVTFVVNDHYIDQLLFVLTLCDKHSTYPHDYFVFHAGLSHNSDKRIASFRFYSGLSMEVIDLGDVFNFVDEKRISRTSVLRLQIPEVIKDKYLHLDLDILPLPGWDAVFELQFAGEQVLIARKDPFISKNVSQGNVAFHQFKEMYFQAGVFLLEPKVWKDNNLDQLSLDALYRYDELGFQFWDQCVLNYIVGTNYGLLPSRFNQLPPEFDKSRTLIIHFAGPRKPWKRGIWNYLLRDFFSLFGIRSSLRLLKELGLFEFLREKQRNLGALYRQTQSQLLYTRYWKSYKKTEYFE